MNRVICLWFPNWSIQRRLHDSPGLHSRPLILFRNLRGREVVSSCCPLAGRRGVRAGMPITEARTLLQNRSGQKAEGRCLAEEPEADRLALRQLAWECEEFSPLVGLEEGEFPAALVLDITGCAHHFGGEQQLAEQLLKRMQHNGFSGRIGLADSLGTAWAAARMRTRLSAVCLVPSGKQEQMLRPLSVSALRLSSSVIERLEQVGLRTIGQLLALPRQTLPARFGAELLERIDQALGIIPELILAERRPEVLRETWSTEFSLQGLDLVEQVVDQLLERLIAPLQSRQQGIKQLGWELCNTQEEKITGTLELLQPSLQRRHLLMLLSLQWETLRWTAGIQRIALAAERIEFLTRRRQTLWELERGPDSPAIDQLVETLTSRLGKQAVSRVYLRAEEQPELAFGCEPIVAAAASPDRLRMGQADGFCGLTRPLWLKQQPVPVEVPSRHRLGSPLRLHWEGTACSVRQAWGPERITTAWWRGELIRRDYFQVELDDGRRAWLFQELVTGKWYLHAVFE